MPENKFFNYGLVEINHLKTKDQKLGEAIDKIGLIKREVNPDLFSSLLKSIVGQQISTKAQETVWARIEERFQPLTPESLKDVSPEELQSCGISMRKANYMVGVIQAVSTGELDLAELETKTDQEVIAELVKLPGIGVWTAEMLLTFSLQRPDIVSYGDLAILRGMRMLYRHRKITPELFKRYARRYSPYGTVASLYLWAIAGGALGEVTDPQTRKKP